MELKKGYKQTEIGVIPEDWETKPLKYLVEFTNGKAHENCITDYGRYIVVNSKFISTEGEVRKFSNNCFCPSEVENILMVMSDVPNGKAIAKCFYVDKNNYYTINQRICSLRVKDDDSKFLFYVVDRNKYFLAFDDGVKQTNLRKNDVLACPIPLPPTNAEQEAIAEALSDADALIESLEKLIAKKRNIKQGTMQQLLTGKKRLPGFSGEWETKPMGQLGKPYGGLSGKSKNDFEDGTHPYIPFLNIMNNPVINTEYFDYVNINANENQNKAMKGDLFFNGSSETPEEVGMCSILVEDVPNLYLNSFCFGFRLNKELKIDGLFLSYFFRSDEGRKLFFSLAQGATRYNLSKSNFMKMEIPLPKPDEQTAIAQVLIDMDAEIESLEQNRDKYKAIKQGMMQELLTGKTRLI